MGKAKAFNAGNWNIDLRPAGNPSSCSVHEPVKTVYANTAVTSGFSDQSRAVIADSERRSSQSYGNQANTGSRAAPVDPSEQIIGDVPTGTVTNVELESRQAGEHVHCSVN